MKNRRDLVYREIQSSLQKYDFFILGVIAAILGYSVQEFNPSDNLLADAIELFGLIFLVSHYTEGWKEGAFILIMENLGNETP